MLVCLNGNQKVPEPLALSGSCPAGQFLQDTVQYAVRNYDDTGHSQVIIVR